MNMRSFTITGLIISLVLLNACGGKPEIKGLTSGTTVVAFGDSLTFGYGAGDDESYPMVLAGLLGCQVVNAGVPGEDSSAGLRRLPAVLAKHKPNLVILCSGGNDMLQKQSKVKTKMNLNSMISLIQNAGAEVVMVGVPEPGLLLKVPSMYEELAKDYELPFDSKTVKTILSTSSLKSDLVHPNAEGYRLMAGEFSALIRHAAGN